MMRVKVIARRMPRNTDVAVERRVDKVVRETANEIADIAKGLAPKDTGYMADSIEVANALGADAIRVVVGADYAPFVEWGTRFQAAQPFLRPAVKFVQSRIRRRLGQIQKGLAQDLGIGQVRR